MGNSDPSDAFQISLSCDIGSPTLAEAIRASRIIHANLAEEANMRKQVLSGHLVEEIEDVQTAFSELPDPPEDTGL
ncbi:MAG: hypothetical protein A2Y38_19015 [Spirochaetes bacterium GWB1_59_5]|nr:MAG: hypothetical protein A2Y38_19015 [Spirochaetes bacterium GWB1_59_5]